MKKIAFLTTAMMLSFLSLYASSTTPRKQCFDHDWLFALNDTLSWQPVSLPHDWSILQPFDQKAPAGNDGGYLPTGKGWYKKTFTLTDDSQNKTFRLYFEGVYMNAEVYVNGHHAGGHPYGYSSFFVDITPYTKKGQNKVEVCVDNSKQKNCRWYSGSGIYRHVWLITTETTHLDEWGLYVRSDRDGDKWTITVDAPYTKTDKAAKLFHTLYDAQGNIVATSSGNQVTQSMTVSHPMLWTPGTPNLYTLKTQLINGETVIDELTTTTGFRSIEYDSTRGLILNGSPILLNGACLHHDNGILGAAAYDRAEQRKAELMKQAGFNAVRTSHNPPSETFLRACDELGLLVIDEAFDGWRDKKNDFDYATLIDQWWQTDLSSMVLRDRNHPCIFCWSIGNEVIERKKIEVVKTAHDMASLCRKLDEHRRPVTSALCAWDKDWEIYDPLAAEHDIVGYNYMIFKSESDHQRIPSRVMMQTESYPRDAWNNYKKVHNEPYVVGDFVWTGLDYIGESGIGRWYYDGDVPGEHYQRLMYPWHGAYCGDVDLTGHRKPISHYRSMLWNQDGEHLYMAVREPDDYAGKVRETQWSTWPTFESWNWPGHEGKPIEVEVYSHYPIVKLYMNDQLIGEQSCSKDNGMKVMFTLPYQPGTLRAEGLTPESEKPVGQVSLTTALDATTISLKADRSTLKADGEDLSFVTIELLDKQGRLNPIAKHQLTASVKGAATLVAFGNADIKDEDPYFDNTHHTWKGRALLVVKSTRKAGSAIVTLSGKGLKSATLRLHTKQ